nr:reverse transcriptase family protein [Citromicrobium bathyomarinum]
MPYVRRWKSKKGDEWRSEEPDADEARAFRPIDIPHPHLKQVQRRIGRLLSSARPPDWLFSPVKGRSYVDNAARHLGSTAFCMLDIADYFPSCTTSAVAGMFLNELHCPPDVASILTSLVTKDGSLPQGSPCSPVVAFYSKVGMWNEIARLVDERGLIHSVYADDLTISGPVIPGEAVWGVKKIVHKHGMRLRRDKEVGLFCRPADITGVIVTNGGLRLPNRQFKRLAELRAQRQASREKEREMIDRKIAGRIAQRRQVEGHDGQSAP